MINILGNFVFWTVLSFVILLAFIIIAFTTHRGKRRNYKYMAIMLMLGIYLSNVTFISSLIFFGNAVEWKENISSYSDVSIKDFSKNTKLPEKNSVFHHFNTEYKIVDSEFLLRDSVLYGLIYSTKMSGLGLKYQALIPVSFYFSIFSGIFFVGLTILSPIVFGGLVASFFEGFFTFIHYFITKNFCDIYYFSDLNEKSLLLAKDINEKQKHCLIVFCNKNKKADTSLLQEAKYNGFILTTRNELDFVKISKHKHCFFEMKNDEVKNLTDVSTLLSEFQKLANKYSSESTTKNILINNQIYLVAEKETSYEVINKLQKCVNVIILNRYKSAFYNLLFNKPLYECLGDRKDFSITVIGSGKCSSEIIKACVWCTQLGNDYSTKINVIDKNATVLEKRLKKECPELISNSYNINFFDCDISTPAFNNILETKCADTNYIAVANGSDDDNLRIAMELRRFYLSSSSEFDNLPVINVYIENDEYLQSVKGLINSSLEDKKNNYILESFGSDKEFYSYSMFNDSDIEKLALNSSCVYWKYRKDNHPEENYTVSELNNMYFFDKEFEKNSNRTNAIHLVYKLYLLGFGIRKKSDPNITQEQKISAPELLKRLKENLADKSKLDNLAYIEHDRWNAFYRSEGWCGIPYDKWDAFKKQYNKQKNYVVKQHACICSYDMLQEVEKKFNGDYRSYDYAFMKYLTMTLGLEKEPNPKEPEINVFGVEYILVEL
ncbi:MAG: hypothetical protein J6K22_03810 [Spirochaetaceae bacterium]|nr:hypothetical protein [Spirochaetaceae bacterium]